MITIIGVRFRCAGKIYYFDPQDQEIPKGTSVIVETARGLEMGTVVLANKEVEEESVVQPLKPVLRIAVPEDFEIIRNNKEREKEAYKICQEKISKHNLDMKLVDVEYTFDNNKILFYFTADGRIDFRELVKDLASVFKTRIELRQIGVRDETKMLGGVGVCGRCLCCSTYLSEFIPVSIKMAKEQNLSLNPSKISGVCGRLMCCLKNEEDTYEYLNSRLPSVGDTVLHKDDGIQGEVQSVNVLRQLVKVIVNLDGDDLEVREYPVDELAFQSKKRKNRVKIDDAELQELEAMEREDSYSQSEEKSRAEGKHRGDGRGKGENHSSQDFKRKQGHNTETLAAAAVLGVEEIPMEASAGAEETGIEDGADETISDTKADSENTSGENMISGTGSVTNSDMDDSENMTKEEGLKSEEPAESERNKDASEENREASDGNRETSERKNRRFEDRREDNRPHRKQENRSERRSDRRTEGKEEKSHRRMENRGDSKSNRRFENRGEEKGDHKYDRKGDYKYGNKSEGWSNRRSEGRNEEWSNRRSEERDEEWSNRRSEERDEEWFNRRSEGKEEGRWKRGEEKNRGGRFRNENHPRREKRFNRDSNGDHEFRQDHFRGKEGSRGNSGEKNSRANNTDGSNE